MKTLRKFLKLAEEISAGAVGAHDVAITPGSLFGGGVVDLYSAKRKKTKLLRRALSLRPEEIKALTVKPNNRWKPVKLTEDLTVTGDTVVDKADVISRLAAAEKRSRDLQDVVMFGLEDDEGRLVKVYIPADQADDFERALEQLTISHDFDEDGKLDMEIAEVLFLLKDKFDIVDVEWSDIPVDEDEEDVVDTEKRDEEEITDDDIKKDLLGDEEDSDEEDTDEDQEEGDDQQPSEEGDIEDLLSGKGEGEEPEDEKSILNKVIDMLKAQAEAREAEARAKEAEAKAEAARYAAQAAAAKVAAEEKVLDMEAYYKEKEEKEKEAKKLAQLARWQHEMARKAEAELSTESVSDDSVLAMINQDKEPFEQLFDLAEDDETLTPEELTDYIVNRVRGGNQ